MIEPETEVVESIFELDPSGPTVVAIGGGHGLAACLEAVQSYASEITAIVSVADDGGSSGRITSSLGLPAPGDIRRCLLALTPEPTLLTELFDYRFDDPADDPLDTTPRDVGGHALGNLVLAALADLTGDFVNGVQRAGEMLGALGVVIPAATAPLTLTGVVDGEEVRGQVAVHFAEGRIESVRLEGDGVAPPAALDAIASADQIVLGPGSLYTSVIAALLVPGMIDAIEASPATLTLVLNLVTQRNETVGMTGRDHLTALHGLTGLTRTGGIVAHRGPLDVPPSVEAVEIDEVEAAGVGWTVFHDDVSDPLTDWPAHDPIRLGQALRRAGETP